MNKQSIISPQLEYLAQFPEWSRFFNALADGYNHFEILSIRKRYLPDVLKYLDSIHGSFTEHIKHNSVYYISLTFGVMPILIFVYTKQYEADIIHLAVVAKDSSCLIDFINTLPLDENKYQGKTLDLSYFYMSSRDGLSEKEIGIEVADLNTIYPELYPDIDIHNLIESYNQAREPLLILYGDPGVGKTSFIKYVISHGDYRKIAYIKDPRVMQDGQLWALLTYKDFQLIIFDDLDSDLLPRRKVTDSTFMTQLLSYSDGIFTQGNTKIVITTNQTVKEIDSALIRPGRCFDFIKLNRLTNTDAKLFWTSNLGLSGETFDSIFGTMQEISQASLMSEAARTTSANSRSYIKRGNSKYTIEQKLAELGIQTSNGDGTRASF